MPNRKAKDRKRKRMILNKKWATEGRTAAQHKKWLTKQEEKGIQIDSLHAHKLIHGLKYIFDNEDIYPEDLNSYIIEILKLNTK